MTLFVDEIGLTRECGDCTMCCEGFLPANIHGYEMKPGAPCHFVQQGTCNGCTIYEDRPNVCKKYECLWKSSPAAVPEWMKPNRSDVILSVKVVTDDDGEQHEFIQMREGYNTVRGDVLNWILRLGFNGDGAVNLEYEVGRHWYFYGNAKWIQYMISSTGPHRQLQESLNHCKHPLPE